MKILVITANTYFLEWVHKVPYGVRILEADSTGLSRIRKAFFWVFLKPRLKILTRRYDVVLCDWFSEIASITSRASSKPIFVRLHRYEIHNPVHIKSARFQNVKGIITVSDFYKKLVREVIDEEVPIYVVRNGVDTEKFSYSPHINNPLKICTVSNLISRKRIFDLIVNNPKLNINIGGDGEEKRILKDIIKRFKLKAKLHGFVDLPEFYHQHDIFIINSSDEACVVALLEAMSCGLIPLSFAWHGAEEILPRNYLYQNYQEMNKKIKEFSEMPIPSLKRIKRKIREIVESRFTLERQAQDFISVLSK